MFEQTISTIKVFVSIIVVGISSFFGPKVNPQTPSSNLIPDNSVFETSPAPTQSASPSAIPTIKPKVFPSPSPSPDIDMDLVLERVLFFPGMKGCDESIERIEKIISGTGELTFKQNCKFEKVSIGMRNNGHESALKTVINIIVDGESVYQKTVDMIEKQSIKYEVIDFDFPNKFGKHKIEIQINPGKLFLEKRFDNNSRVYEYEYLD